MVEKLLQKEVDELLKWAAQSDVPADVDCKSSLSPHKLEVEGNPRG